MRLTQEVHCKKYGKYRQIFYCPAQTYGNPKRFFLLSLRNFLLILYSILCKEVF